MYCATKRRWHLSARRSMHRKHTLCRLSRVNNFSGALTAKISLNSRTYPAQSVTPLLYRANKSARGANCGTDLYRAQIIPTGPRGKFRRPPQTHIHQLPHANRIHHCDDIVQPLATNPNRVNFYHVTETILHLP